MSGTFQRIGSMCPTRYAPQAAARDGQVPARPRALPITPHHSMGRPGECGIGR